MFSKAYHGSIFCLHSEHTIVAISCENISIKSPFLMLLNFISTQKKLVAIHLCAYLMKISQFVLVHCCWFSNFPAMLFHSYKISYKKILRSETFEKLCDISTCHWVWNLLSSFDKATEQFVVVRNVILNRI